MNSTDYGPRDLVGYGAQPPNPEWPGGAKIAINIVLNYEEGSELTPENGDKTSEFKASELGPGIPPLEERNINIESLYEYGSRSGVWRILRLLDEYKIKSTSFAVGMALEQNPAVGKALVEAGHEVGSHGYRWISRENMTAEEEEQSIRDAIQAIRKTSGKPPRGWYWGNVATPGSSRSRALVAKVFKEEGLPLCWYADSYADDLPYWIPYPGGDKKDGLLIIPYSLDNNDYKTTQAMDFVTSENFFQYLKDGFDELYREGEQGSPKMMSVGLHARLIGRPGRIAGLRRFIEYAQAKENVWFATREEIANHWTTNFPYKPQQQ